MDQGIAAVETAGVAVAGSFIGVWVGRNVAWCDGSREADVDTRSACPLADAGFDHRSRLARTAIATRRSD